jgi:hypothetical protein
MKLGRITSTLVGAAALGAIAVLAPRPSSQAANPPLPAPATSTAPVVAASLDNPRFKQIHGRPGFWRIGQTQDGVWWFVDTHDQTEFLNGVTTVQPQLLSYDPAKPAYASIDWDGRPDAESLTHWADLTTSRVHAIGFKSLGAWCNPALQSGRLPMTQDLNIWHWVPYTARLFSPDWRQAADYAIKSQTEPLKNNHNLIGYYTDNELSWDDNAVGARVYFDDLPTDDPNRQQVLGVIQKTWPSVTLFNQDWNTKLGKWDELRGLAQLPTASNAAYDKLESHWLEHIARAYFEMTSTLVHKYDPNHLVLGCRYRGWMPAEVARASRGLTDAQSLNYYASDSLLDSNTFRTLSEESGQPVVISEYSFHSLDGRSGNRNLSRFPAEVRDQEARAAGYRLMTQRLARVAYVIGADWFQWMDEPPAGRRGDAEDCNLGMVDIHDRPYEQLVTAVQETAPLLNPLHAGSATAGNQMVWRTPPQGPHHPTAFAGGQEMLNQK